jgi:hypothetical protein
LTEEVVLSAVQIRITEINKIMELLTDKLMTETKLSLNHIRAMILTIILMKELLKEVKGRKIDRKLSHKHILKTDKQMKIYLVLILATEFMTELVIDKGIE